MARLAPIITPEELKQKIVEYYLKRYDFEEELNYEYAEGEDPLTGLPALDDWGKTPTVTELISRVLNQDVDRSNKKLVDDLTKIEVSFENFGSLDEDGTFSPDGDNFQLLPNFVPVLCVMFGGDWETPLGAVIYWDGHDVRGYVPEEGNVFNQSQKSAYGNNVDHFDFEDEDDEDETPTDDLSPTQDDVIVTKAPTTTSTSASTIEDVLGKLEAYFASNPDHKSDGSVIVVKQAADGTMTINDAPIDGELNDVPAVNERPEPEPLAPGTKLTDQQDFRRNYKSPTCKTIDDAKIDFEKFMAAVANRIQVR